MSVLIRLSELLVFVSEDHGGVSGELRLESAANLDVGLQLSHRVDGLECSVLQSVHVHDVTSDGVVLLIVLFVKDDEEKVETRHDGGRNVHIVAKGFSPVVSASVRVGCGKDRGTSIESSMNTSLRN